MPATDSSAIRNIVLVHGGFVDGSGWAAVYGILKKDGYDVAVVQNPTLSMADDVAVTKRAIAAQRGPVLLVGHSYGGGGGPASRAPPPSARRGGNAPLCPPPKG